jgi:hypothetical protein
VEDKVGSEKQIWFSYLIILKDDALYNLSSRIKQVAIKFSCRA